MELINFKVALSLIRSKYYDEDVLACLHEGNLYIMGDPADELRFSIYIIELPDITVWEHNKLRDMSSDITLEELHLIIEFDTMEGVSLGSKNNLSEISHKLGIVVPDKDDVYTLNEIHLNDIKYDLKPKDKASKGTRLYIHDEVVYNTNSHVVLKSESVGIPFNLSLDRTTMEIHAMNNRMKYDMLQIQVFKGAVVTRSKEIWCLDLRGEEHTNSTIQKILDVFDMPPIIKCKMKIPESLPSTEGVLTFDLSPTGYIKFNDISIDIGKLIYDVSLFERPLKIRLAIEYFEKIIHQAKRLHKSELEVAFIGEDKAVVVKDVGFILPLKA